MQEQAQLMRKHLKDKQERHQKKRDEMAAAKAKYEAAKDDQNEKLRERATETLVGNIFTFGIYGMATAGDAAEQRK